MKKQEKNNFVINLTYNNRFFNWNSWKFFSFSTKDFKNPKVIKILKKNKIENIDPEKLVKNLKTIEQMDPTIPIKYKTCGRYSCSYDYDAYYSAILNDYYNNRNDKVELYQKLEK